MTAVRLNDYQDEEKHDSKWTDVFDTTTVSTTGVSVGSSIASAAAAGSSSTGTASGDLLGKKVRFPNGDWGVVVAHRPPLVFVYRDDAALKAGTWSSSNQHSITMEEEKEAKDGLVLLYPDMVTISVPSNVQHVDGLGRSNYSQHAMDDGDDATARRLDRAMFAPIPQVKDIALINHPLLTGVTMLDVLAPIGRGQNMLLIGHDVHMMRGLAMDLIRTQLCKSPHQDDNNSHQNNNNSEKKGDNVNCIYVAIDDEKEVMRRLQAAGIADDVLLVSPPPTNADRSDDVSRAASAVATAATGCAIAEALALEEGRHSVVIVDTIDWHKKLWDYTTRVLVDVFGQEAVVRGDREGGASSEMRAYYSSLIQRSAQYRTRPMHSGEGGSVTLLLLTTIPRIVPADDSDNVVFLPTDFEQSTSKIRDRINVLMKKQIPLTSSNLRKIGIPIPSAAEGQRRLALQHVDDLISMTDGQIWLDEGLDASGQMPPICPQKSLTRIGIGADTESRADAPALRRVAEGLRLILSQAADMSNGADSATASKKQVQRHRALLLAMHQTPGSGGRRLSESCTALLAASLGYLDHSVGDDHNAMAGSAKDSQLMDDLLAHVRQEAEQAMSEIDLTLDMDVATQGALTNAIASFFGRPLGLIY